VFDGRGIGCIRPPARDVHRSRAEAHPFLAVMSGVLVALVILFLGHFRTAFISLTAIPLSLLTAIM
jgi:multidrug efflux pump subunit AcrB